MADLQRGFVPIMLDRERILRFTLKETWLLVQQYGDDFLSVLYEKSKGSLFGVQLRDPEVMKVYLLIGLQWDAEQHSEVLTPELVESLITPLNFRRTFTALMMALTHTHTTAEPQGNGNAGGAKAVAAGAQDRPKPAVLTSRTRKASPSRSSASRRKPSGR